MEHYDFRSGHPHAQPNFRNLIIRPMWITMKTALRTIPLIGRLPFLHNDYHNKRVSMTDGFTEQRIGSDHVSTKWTDSGSYAADREASEVMPTSRSTSHVVRRSRLQEAPGRASAITAR